MISQLSFTFGHIFVNGNDAAQPLVWRHFTGLGVFKIFVDRDAVTVELAFAAGHCHRPLDGHRRIDFVVTAGTQKFNAFRQIQIKRVIPDPHTGEPGGGKEQLLNTTLIDIYTVKVPVGPDGGKFAEQIQSIFIAGLFPARRERQLPVAADKFEFSVTFGFERKFVQSALEHTAVFDSSAVDEKFAAFYSTS